MILLDINDMTYYDEAKVLIKAFHPFTEVSTESGGEHVEKRISICVSDCRISVLIDGKITEADAPDSSKKSMYDAVKTALYKALRDNTGKNLPWGSLTGVRPTKIVVGKLEEGRSDEEIRHFLADKYFVSDRKIDLSLDVARREKELLEKIDYKNGYSIYIGIPFCPTTCLYCSFTSYPIGLWKKRTDEYVDALLKEMDFTSKTFGKKMPDTVYFGGGTPTTLEAYQLDKILTALEDKFDLSGIRELTVEAGRPDSVTKEKLEVLKKHNVSRISINPQTMNQKTLDLIGRRHTVEQVKDAFYMARDLGFDNINMDLIVGLPGETIDDVRYTMEEITKLSPDNLTVHSLAIKRAAALNLWKDKYSEAITNTDEIIEMTADYARNMNLNPYYLYRQKNMAGNFENVGYAKKSTEGLYNILIMEEKQTIIAMGAGGSSKFVFPDENRIERIENVKDVRNYIERIDEMIERKRNFFNENNL
ncbi:MAG: coproporphyrinogen dehydrogenase HemZ [Lachnospiraceae bacterium]